MDDRQFWTEMLGQAAEAGARDALKYLPPLHVYAVTTGDVATTEAVGTITTSQVMVWLSGVDQTADNKTSVVLPYGQAAPAAGELWLVLLPNFAPPGVLLVRLA